MFFENEEDNDVPEIVGLSKWQFFGFFLASILMGAACFGLGYTLAFFKSKSNNANNPPGAHNQHASEHGDSKNQVKLNKSATEEYVGSYYNLPPDNLVEISNAKENERKSAQPKIVKTFIIMGLFNSQAAAADLQKKLEKIGKASQIKNNTINFTVFLGPYESYDQAKNERDAIALTCSLSGSLVHDI
jgi:uncharacterized protein (UPF0333 family)